jgi:CDP-diacylglycerol--glycerol-3-phosphate 3-phosphatidyltransferase
MPSLRLLPDLITALRLALVPAIVAGAWRGLPQSLVLGSIVFCFLTDLVDGALARRLGTTSAASARLDSIADGSFYLALPLIGWLAWPEVTLREAGWFAVGAASVALPALAAAVKFGAASGYHVWLAKAAAGSLAVGIPLLFALDIALPFRVAVLLAALAALEEIAITLALDAPRADVRGLWQVLAERHRTGTA